MIKQLFWKGFVNNAIVFQWMLIKCFHVDARRYIVFQRMQIKNVFMWMEMEMKVKIILSCV